MVCFPALILFTLISCGWALEPPTLLLFDKRQDVEPGTPVYECHADCGYAILASETDGYCSNSTFTSELESCLDCALTYNIWQYYGDQVAAAASACGDNAAPSPSSATAIASATGSVASSTTAIAAASSSASPTTMHSSTATTWTSSIASSATDKSSAASSSSVAPAQFTGAASSLKENGNWFPLFGLAMIGFL